MSESYEGEVVEATPVVLHTPKSGGKPFPSVDCPACKRKAVWIGRPSYSSRGHRFITYACVEDDGCGSEGSRPLREEAVATEA